MARYYMQIPPSCHQKQDGGIAYVKELFPPQRLTGDRHIRRYGSHVIRAAPLPACPVSDTPEGDRKV